MFCLGKIGKIFLIVVLFVLFVWVNVVGWLIVYLLRVRFGCVNRN